MRAAGDLEGGEGLNILRTVGMAFALYSRIPMPRLDWESESRKYTLYAFPLVGIAVGIFELLWLWMSQVLDLHTILTGAVLAALPIWVTGGIHLDGFCDVCDARGLPPEPGAEAGDLKDSNVGAFAVIHCVLLLLVTFGLWCQLEPADSEVWGALVLLPVFSRCLSAFGALSLPNARGSGMLASVDRRGAEAARPLGAAAGEPAVCGRSGGAGALVPAGGGGGIPVLRLLCAHGEAGVRRHHRGPVRVVFAAVRALIPGRSGAGPAAGGAVMILVVGGLGAGKRRFILKNWGMPRNSSPPYRRRELRSCGGWRPWTLCRRWRTCWAGRWVACREVGCGVVPWTGRPGLAGGSGGGCAATWPPGRRRCTG